MVFLQQWYKNNAVAILQLWQIYNDLLPVVFLQRRCVSVFLLGFSFPETITKLYLTWKNIASDF